jgi:transposase
MLQQLTRRTRASKGKTPVPKAWDRHERLNYITVLTISPKCTGIGQYFQILRTNAKADQFFWFIVEINRQLKRALIVVWDRLSAHLKTESYFRQLEIIWVRFKYLPAYSPESNPVEHIWTTTKWGRLSNRDAQGVEQLKSAYGRTGIAKVREATFAITLQAGQTTARLMSFSLRRGR